jgi:hypothetical protein
MSWDENVTGSSLRSKIIAGLFGVGVLLLLAFSGLMFEKVEADEVVVIRKMGGDLIWHTTPGAFKWQGFGRPTHYPKRSIYEFNTRIRFNEGGHAQMVGSIQWEMPLDTQNLNSLHSRFGSAGAIQNQLVKVVTDKAVYMTGPLLSSTESYAEKRSNLINWVEDQILLGIYRTTQTAQRVVDPLTGDETTVTIVEVQMNDMGVLLRQEEAQLTAFGVRPFNFAVTSIEYDEVVEAQIQQQQKNIMQVQTAIAEAREAEQRTITLAQQGEANAAEAKWEQEVLKAKAVTQAEQQLEVARLDRQAAEEYRQQQILIGQGDAERKRLTMQADGALQQKLATLEKINGMWASAWGGMKWPEVVMGGANGTEPATAATDLVNLLVAQQSRALGLDLGVRGQ